MVAKGGGRTPFFIPIMYEKELIEYLEDFVSARRMELFDKVLVNRTNYLTVVLEDIYQPHNASAVLRTCDCLGIQKVHIIENRNKYNVNPDVALGSDKWLSLVKYNEKENNTADAYSALKKNDYRIVATVPRAGKEVSLDDFDISRGKTALVFGTEMHGLSKQAVDQADEYLKIPMFGFTESYNISVSAALILYQLVKSLHNSDIPWQLDDREKTALKLNWLKKTIKRSDLLEKKFMDMKRS